MEEIAIGRAAKETKWAKTPIPTAGGYGQPPAMMSLACTPLASMPMVYRYLFDGEAPDKELIADRIAQYQQGNWSWYVGVRASLRAIRDRALRPYPSAPRTAEITYLLNPGYWGQGLAVRMAWTAIAHAFGSSQIDAVVAGADQPNTASLVVMRHLGMWFHQNVRYRSVQALSMCFATMTLDQPRAQQRYTSPETYPRNSVSQCRHA